MKTERIVQAHVDNVQFGYWNTETNTFVPVNVTRQDDVDIAAETLECSKLLIDTLGILTMSITDRVGKDLKDIWRRLDEAGI